MKFPFFLTTLLCVVQIGTCAKILFLITFGAPSHFNVFRPIIEALAARGHDLTVVTNTQVQGKHNNIRQIFVPSSSFQDHAPDLFKMALNVKSFSVLDKLQNPFKFLNDDCKNSYTSANLKDLVREHFDLIILNGWYQCYNGFVAKNGAPFIQALSMPAPESVTSAIGNRMPPSFVPGLLSGFNHEMKFFQRILNQISNIVFQVLVADDWKWTMERIYKEQLGQDLPSADEVAKNVSLIFSNSHFTISNPRPYLPQVIEIAGVHCRPAQPLPQDLDLFLSGAEDGFIYFSLGTVADTKDMPESIRLKFLHVFSRLKQRVIWKWNSGEMANLPANVRVSSWLPQQDILGHPKIKVFITHGGLFSTQEAVYHGVPLLGTPFYMDQIINMKTAVEGGYALSLQIMDFTEEELEDKLKRLLYDIRYHEKAKHLSAVFKDQPETPLERAVFWAEYVIRHKGTVHMRSAARNLSFVQYHSLDVAAFLLVIASFVVAFIYLIVRACFQAAYKLISKQNKIKKS